MDKCLRPQIFDTDANSEEGPRKWLHWKRTFESFIRRVDGATDRDKLDLLINFIETNVYSYITECTTYAKKRIGIQTSKLVDCLTIINTHTFFMIFAFSQLTTTLKLQQKHVAMLAKKNFQ